MNLRDWWRRGRRRASPRTGRWHLLPDSARGRSALLIGLALLASQLAMSLLLRDLVVGPAAEQLGNLLADQVTLLQSVLAATPPADRPAALARLAGAPAHDARLRLADDPPPPVAPSLFYQQKIAAALAARLGPAAEMRVQWGAETLLWVRPTPAAPYWLGMTARRLEQGVPGVLALWVLLLLGTAAAGGAVLGHFLNRHLARLTDLSARVARGELPVHFAVGGPRELRALGQTLERMARDLHQAAEDRALLLAGISHDLRTPLARLRLSVEMLSGADPELRDGIAADVEDMDAIIGQFIATIRDGHDEAPRWLDPNAAIRAAAARSARGRVAPSLDLAPLPPLALRPVAFGRLLTNLLENAQRHAAGPLAVTSGRVGERVVVRVLDRGPGIAPAHLDALFTPFRRGSTGATGSGLGLVIARRIARLHGGELTLHNRPDGGLEARIELPLPERDGSRAAREGPAG